MAYYNPYAYQDPYGYQIDDSPPPEPSKDWVDVPKINRSYVRKIPRQVIKEEFSHLKTDQMYGIEAMVEYVTLNEELSFKQEPKEEVGDDIVSTLKIMKLPQFVINSEKFKNDQKQETVSLDRSATSLNMAYPPLPEYFQRVLPYLTRIADESEMELDDEVKEEEKEEGEGAEEVVTERKGTWTEKQNETVTEEAPKRTKINIEGGSSTLFLMTGMSMIQKLQTHTVTVAVGRREVVETEEGSTTDVVPLGMATTRFPQNFHQAVLRRSATKSTLSIPLVEDDGQEVGEVALTITLVSIGQGIEVEILGDSTVYGKVKLIETFPPDRVECIFDPVVHPRLAVTLMNMEPPLNLNRTSSEIIQACLESKMITLEDVPTSQYEPRKCRWLEIAKQFALKSSKPTLSTGGSDVSEGRVNAHMWPSSMLNCPRTEVDPELDLLWRQHKQKCVELWEEVEVIENNKRSIYVELEELLRQDKGESWESEVLSTKSKPSGDEERKSKPSRSSSIKSTLKSIN